MTRTEYELYDLHSTKWEACTLSNDRLNLKRHMTKIYVLSTLWNSGMDTEDEYNEQIKSFWTVATPKHMSQMKQILKRAKRRLYDNSWIPSIVGKYHTWVKYEKDRNKVHFSWYLNTDITDKEHQTVDGQRNDWTTVSHRSKREETSHGGHQRSGDWTRYMKDEENDPTYFNTNNGSLSIQHLKRVTHGC